MPPLRLRLAALCACVVAVVSCDAAAPRDDAKGVRLVSLSPSVTAIVLALGAQESLVGVDSSSAEREPRVAHLPTVGGLFNPSLEAIVSLEPDIVALVPSAQQRDLETRLGEFGIEVLALRNVTTMEVLASIGVLGAQLDRQSEAQARVMAIREAWADGNLSPREDPPSAVIVLQRDPLYVVGSGSYLDAMLVAAGAHNLGAEFEEAYPRVSVEWLIEAGPALILDAADPPDEAEAHWQRWPSLPAVVASRVHVLEQQITVPGPFLDESLALLRAHVAAGATP
ncbi:MAG: helical backbone metal receptor [Myxococcota bacterium]